MKKVKYASLFLIVILSLLNTSFMFGETLFFNVSPFDNVYGFTLRYNFNFWKFDVRFYLPVDVKIKMGFPQIDAKFSDIIDKFHFEDYPYKVTYDFINQIPFTTFINPAQKVWYSTWLKAGYYGDKLFYIDDNFSIIGDSKNLNVSLNILGYTLFVEKIDNNYIFGAGKGIYAFFGNKSGMGINYVKESLLIYYLLYLADGKINSEFGFSLKGDNFEFNIVNNINSPGINGSIVWKVGEIYVVGRQQGEKVCLAVEFPIW
ncbi:MAG TPA: hypothetical protein PK390_06860 [Fervidobacterium nodosum]|nr:hypothetical protein [Fervidobacterium nodosum]